MKSNIFVLIILLSFILIKGLFTSVYSQPKNELPLYGGQVKSKEEIALDEKFIKESTEAAGSREKAFQQIMDRAWAAISKRATNEAIRRFNQGYLLNPKDFQVYWGLGIASGMRNNLKEAESLFEKAYKLNPKSARLLCDYGHALVGQALSLPRKQESEKFILDLFSRADKLYREAIQADSKLALTYSRLAILDYYKGDFKSSWTNVELSKARGGEGLDPMFLADLQKASPNNK